MNTRALAIYAILTIILALLLIASTTARQYDVVSYDGAYNAGYAWDWGGIEYRGDPGIFLCPGNYDPDTNTYIRYPWADLFPKLVTDC